MNSPFKFLDSFDKNDKDIFFGRERETEELYQKIFESKILLVYGVSGTGKSSLIHCGLANKFEDSDWLPINVRRVSNINKSLISSIQSLATEKVDESKSLKKQLQSLYLDHFKPIYLIFDQFEELFIFGTEDEKKEFIKSVKKIAESELQVKFLFVIREEYLASITEFEREIPEFLENRIRIEKMRRQNAEECINGPCKVHKIEVEEGFAKSLLDKLSPDSSDIELTYLQVYLDKVFRISDKQHFHLNLLEQIGNVSDLLGDFLEEQIAQLDKPEDALAILKSFVSNKGTKRPATREEIVSYATSLGRKIDAVETDQLIQSFVGLRILRDKDDNNRYELRHDALAAKIFEKISGDEKELMEVRQFVENAYEVFQNRNILLSSDDVRYLSEYESRITLRDELNEFVSNSKKEHKARKRSLRRVTIISAFAFVAMISFLIYLGNDKINTDWSGTTALEAITVFDNPYDQFARATHAYLLADTKEAHLALMSTFQIILAQPGGRDSIKAMGIELPDFVQRSFPAEIIQTGFTGKSNNIYCFTNDSLLNVFDSNGKTILQKKMQYALPISVWFSDTEQHFAVLSSDSLLSLYSIQGELKTQISAVYTR
ncbi:MAG: hypothetical protein C0594_09300, partial [Marinilabiliales bacterium]